MILVVIAVAVAAVAAVAWLWRRVPDPQRSTQAERWATSEGVELDATTQPVVAGYLRTSRNLRQIGFVGGLVVPPAVTAGTGIDLGLPGLLWPLLGYLIGCLWAELALTRRHGSGPRTASLAPRRLADYLPRAMLVTQVLVAALVAVVGLVSAVALRATADATASGWAADASPTDLRRSAAVAAVLAAVTMAGVLATQRRIVGRPQPLRDPGHIAVDDAMRSSSVRLVGTTGLAIVGVLALAPAVWIARSLDDSGPAAISTIALVILLTAMLQWRWWPHRGWQVRRPGTGFAAASAPATTAAPTGAPRA